MARSMSYVPGIINSLNLQNVKKGQCFCLQFLSYVNSKWLLGHTFPFSEWPGDYRFCFTLGVLLNKMVTIFQRKTILPVMIIFVSMSLQWNYHPILCCHQAFTKGTGDGFTEILICCPHSPYQAMPNLATLWVNQNLAETPSNRKFIFNGRIDTKNNSWSINP